mgnify:CR=1 FL=1
MSVTSTVAIVATEVVAVLDISQNTVSPDELIVLNASKKNKDLKEFGATVSKLVNDVFIPISVGGGIKSLKDMRCL